MLRWNQAVDQSVTCRGSVKRANRFALVRLFISYMQLLQQDTMS